MRGPAGRRATLALGVVVAVLAVTALALHPTVRSGTKAVLVLDGAFDGPLPRSDEASIEPSEQVLGDVVVDRYSPADDAPPILLVPGAAPAGRDDERVVAFASALASAGREVVVPELRLYEQELDAADVERVVEVAARLCPDDGGLVLFGFSFGGSLALVAAADERVRRCIDLVATFGAYADLAGMLQAAVTGVSVVDGETYPWEVSDEEVLDSVLRDAATELVPADQADALRAALEQRDPDGLPPAARQVYRMMTADDPMRVADLARDLPPPGNALVETFSPVAVADRIEADVLAAHALDDPAVPSAELLRLRAAFPQAEVLAVRSFSHVDLTTEGGVGPLVADMLIAWRFLQAVLREQQEWPWE